ncbi:MAG: MFS transporter [Sphingomonadales bacterium]|nr:MFS transporter [Sphingomonadales bacterium]
MRSMVIAISALFISAAFLFTGHGLQLALIPIAAANAGFSHVAIGFLWSGYTLGLMIGCLTVPRIIAAVGHIRAFAALGCAVAALLIAFSFFSDAKAWLVLRFLQGFMLAGVFIAVESWLNDKTANELRGVVLSSYSTLTLVMISLGQLSLTLFGPGDPRLFSLAAFLTLLAVIPVALTRADAPQIAARVKVDVNKLWTTSRVAVLGSVLVGLANSAFWGLGPVFGRAAGLSASELSLYLSITIWGGAACQWLMGRLSDRFDRRRVVAAASFMAAGAGIAMTYSIGRSYALLLAASFVFGASSFSLSAICVAMAHDRARPGEFLETSGGLLFIFSVGSTLGSLLASTAMELAGFKSLYLYTAVVHGVLALTALGFSFARPAVPRAEKQEFRPLPQTSPEALAIDPRSHKEPD